MAYRWGRVWPLPCELSRRRCELDRRVLMLEELGGKSACVNRRWPTSTAPRVGRGHPAHGCLRMRCFFLRLSKSALAHEYRLCMVVGATCPPLNCRGERRLLTAIETASYLLAKTCTRLPLCAPVCVAAGIRKRDIRKRDSERATRRAVGALAVPTTPMDSPLGRGIGCRRSRLSAGKLSQE